MMPLGSVLDAIACATSWCRLNRAGAAADPGMVRWLVVGVVRVLPPRPGAVQRFPSSIVAMSSVWAGFAKWPVLFAREWSTVAFPRVMH